MEIPEFKTQAQYLKEVRTNLFEELEKGVIQINEKNVIIELQREEKKKIIEEMIREFDAKKIIFDEMNTRSYNYQLERDVEQNKESRKLSKIEDKLNDKQSKFDQAKVAFNQEKADFKQEKTKLDQERLEFDQEKMKLNQEKAEFSEMRDRIRNAWINGTFLSITKNINIDKWLIINEDHEKLKSEKIKFESEYRQLELDWGNIKGTNDSFYNDPVYSDNSDDSDDSDN